MKTNLMGPTDKYSTLESMFDLSGPFSVHEHYFHRYMCVQHLTFHPNPHVQITAIRANRLIRNYFRQASIANVLGFDKFSGIYKTTSSSSTMQSFTANVGERLKQNHLSGTSFFKSPPLTLLNLKKNVKIDPNRSQIKASWNK